MTERPILFSDAMVRAILAGTKTITRRVLTPQPIEDSGEPISVGRYHPTTVRRGLEEPGDERFGAHTSEQSWPCPYGEPGDRLWVRERFSPRGRDGAESSIDAAVFAVHANGAQTYRDGTRFPALPAYAPGAFDGVRFRPSIHMPRWASRLTLEVTSVRVERVQSISEDDARAEGALSAKDRWSNIETARDSFAHLWDSISGARPGCSWSDNPWVWVVGFRRVSP